tara:strand:- start:100 stop:702 length:603 start_codon:yes stop_codon:yes gene_type:complete
MHKNQILEVDYWDMPTNNKNSKNSMREISLPDGVNVSLSNDILEITGPLGKSSKNFRLIRTKLDCSDDKIIITSLANRKKSFAVVGTVYSIINNMITGVQKGFTYKLQTAFAHFPMAVKVENNKVLIENFYGERKARSADIVGDVNIKINNDVVVITGINLEEVSQTAANIEQSTRIKNKDLRVFLDGVYLYEKGSGINE